MLKSALFATIATIALLGTQAHAADTTTLTENMKMTLAGCTDSTKYGFFTDSREFLEDQCVKVTFQALQTYVDAASTCIDSPSEGDACMQAKVLEEGLIKTFQQPQE